MEADFRNEKKPCTNILGAPTAAAISFVYFKGHFHRLAHSDCKKACMMCKRMQSAISVAEEVAYFNFRSASSH